MLQLIKNKKSTKKNWKIFFLIFINIVTSNVFAGTQVLDRIVAIVNNTVVLKSEIDSLIKSIKISQNQKNFDLPDDNTLYHQILEQLIMEKILFQESKKMKITISDKQVDQVINNIARNNNLTVNQMRNRLQLYGINYSTYRNNTQKDMLISAILNNAVRNRVRISPEEIEKLSKKIKNENDPKTEINLMHILILFPENATSDQILETKTQADFIIRKIEQKNAIDSLKTNGFICQNLLKIEKIGWIQLQELPFNFAQKLILAKKGDVIGPIVSSIGFHILKVNDLINRKKNIFIKEFHARHILLKKSPVMTNNQAQIKLRKISSDIETGKTTFADAAKQFSQDFVTANQGGDLGWIRSDEYDPTIISLLTRMKKNKLSSPISSSFGWHIIELLDTRKIDITDEEKRNKAYQILFDQKFTEEAEIWMQEKRASTYIKIINS